MTASSHLKRKPKARGSERRSETNAPSAVSRLTPAPTWTTSLPLARGGKHEPRNIQFLCEHCNLTKNARDPIDHMQSLGRLL